MPEHAQGHLDILLVCNAVHKLQQHLLRHLYLCVALPAVPHTVRTVEDYQHTRMLLGRSRLRVCNGSAKQQEEDNKKSK
jgi:hypothetical protein